MTGTDASVDVSTKQNLEKLQYIGERILKKPVSRVNLETGLSEPVENGGTNEEALKKYGRTCVHTHVHNYMPLYYIYNLYIIIKNISHNTNFT